MTLPTRLLLPAALAALLAGALSAPAGAQPHPRLGLYASILGNGYPLLLPGGAMDTAAVAMVARYDVVTLDVNPVTPYHPELLAELRRRNPDIRVLGYVLGHDIWAAADADSLVHFPTRYRRLVRDLGGFLFNSVGGGYYPGANVNLAKRDGSGRYVVAEGLADLFHDAIVRSGLWDGVFIDVFCRTIGWSQGPTQQIDHVRAGYPSLAAFEAAWTAGADTLANRLRRLSGAGPVLCGNCAQSAHTEVFQGWMRENFPYQGGGDWYRNMLDDPHGYFADERDYLAPQHNWIFTAMSGGTSAPYSSDNTRRVRFGLASASLGGGYATFGPSDRVATTAPYHTYWYDEYAVDRVSGDSSPAIAHTGWLGDALGPPYQMIWAGTNPDAVSNPGFESSATAGWDFVAAAPAAATRTQQVGGAPVGAAALHIQITAGGPNDYSVSLASQGSIYVVAGQNHAVTFWARAVPARDVPVVASRPGGGGVASRTITIGPEWKQYQVILTPSQSAQSSLHLYLSRGGPGEIWFDDVHFQQGATNLYRRDFQHGIVLVNPASQSLQVPLGREYRRIRGTAAPFVNDGARVQSVLVPPQDALFLLEAVADTIPPAAITDVELQP